MINETKKRYILVTIVTISLLVFNQAFIQYWLHKKTEDSLIINIAGRQRMLSQQIDLEFQRVHYNGAKIDFLKDLFRQWTTAHDALLHGDEQYGISGIENSTSRQSLLALAPYFEQVEKRLNDIDKCDTGCINAIHTNQKDFLAKMELVVKKLEKSASQKLRFIVITELVLAMLSILVILFELYYVFRPAIARLTSNLIRMQKSESTLRAVYTNSTEGIQVINRSHRIIYQNRVAEEFCNLVAGKTPSLDENALLYTIPEQREFFTECYKKVLAGENFQFEKTRGNQHWLFLLFPVYDEQQNITGVATLIQEISNLKKKEQQIEEQLKKLKSIARKQSHDVRRPLANIILLSDLIDDQLHLSASADTKQCITYLKQETQELDKIIRGIVKSARIEGGAEDPKD